MQLQLASVMDSLKVTVLKEKVAKKFPVTTGHRPEERRAEGPGQSRGGRSFSCLGCAERKDPPIVFNLTLFTSTKETHQDGEQRKSSWRLFLSKVQRVESKHSAF